MIASVHPKNKASIRLHEKCGFQDTGKPCEFPTFFFDPAETAFEKWIYQYLPVPDVKGAADRLLPLWMEAHEGAQRKDLERVIKDAAKGKCTLEAIWCGNRLVGFRYGEGLSITEYFQK